MEQTLKGKLESNIWITRKCRINASERLLANARYLELLNVYYSVFMILFSLLSLDGNRHLSLAGLICTIALTIFIMYANTIVYRYRSAALKQNYIELQTLLDRLCGLKDTYDNKELLEISEKYADLMKSSENHLDIDLYKTRVNNGERLCCMEAAKRWWHLFWVFVLRFLLFAIPAVALVLLWRTVA